MTTDDFKVTKFFELPWSILKQICLYLDIDQLTELMDAPQLQEMIFDLLCSKDLHILTAKRDVEVLWNEKYVAINKNTIADFFESYPDISPRTYCVIVQGGYANDVTTCLHQRLNRASDIAICSLDDIPENVTEHDLTLLFSYPGIQTVELDREIVLAHDGEIAFLVPQITGLKTLSLAIENRTRLPFLSGLAHLEHLTITTEFYGADNDLDFVNDSSHKILCEMFSQVSYLPEPTPLDPKFPPLLKSLLLNELCLRTVEVSHLPPTLETLDLSSNQIHIFEYEKSTPMWPSNLKRIDLLSNWISDKSLKQLLCIEWPSNLQSLSLEGNLLNSLEDLRNLPDSITNLTLCGDWTSFEVSHNPDGYPFFKFPKSLRTFLLDNQQYLFDDDDDEDDYVEVEGRIKFPPNLEHLTLRDVGMYDCLKNLIFPPTLKTLHLEKICIENLNSYNSLPGDVEEVNWAQLTNLEELKLNKNKISSLSQWCPPKLLRNLELMENQIASLRSELTPLFNKKCKEMTKNLLRIDLRANRIATIDNNVYLPENLYELNLKDNCLLQFVLTESFASHCSLTKLDLRKNLISEISVHDPEKKYASQLQDLYLSENKHNILPNEYEAVFERLGLVPKRCPGRTGSILDFGYSEGPVGMFYFKH